MRTAAFLCLALTGFFPLFAWEEHHRITRESLRNFDAAKGSVAYRTPDTDRFIRELRLNKNWRFASRLNERPGEPVPVIDILSVYSDEPDWGADNDLFDEDQYPELWNEDLAYVTRKRGPASQAFRHQYFPGRILWSEPLASFQTPLRPLGEAPDRIALLFRLSQTMFAEGSPYWGWRMLAWTLHYIEDLYQPFHVRQIPTSSFLRFRLDWPPLDVQASSQEGVYHHSSYEKWAALEMEGSLVAALSAGKSASPVEGTLREFVLEELVPEASLMAWRIGEGCFAVFPPRLPADVKDPEEAFQPEAMAPGSPRWRKSLRKGEPAKELREATASQFSKMGVAIRRIALTSARGR